MQAGSQSAAVLQNHLITVTVLGIESSCDETSAAVVQDGILRSNVISSQHFHGKYGGVVPELASRAHLRTILPIIAQALKDADIGYDALDAVAATQGPGLIGSLLVGLNTGKGIALGRDIPFLPVHHIEAHLFSPFLQQPQPEFPYLGLVVSGGHTLLIEVRNIGDYRLLGSTIDDAAGEAFDKVAKMLDLGYPGGPEIDRRARRGNPTAIRFARPLRDSGDYRFSFSGLKTSVLYHLRDRAVDGVLDMSEDEVDDVCASFQRAVTDVLVVKVMRASAMLNLRDIAIVGGVSANTGLQAALRAEADKKGRRIFVPDIAYSTDNAAMVAMLASMQLLNGAKGTLHAPAFARISDTMFHE
ncbi:MAG: tRNA (adenosine(37)-N6)-threonylcarbamoyltransferase complex transferase subunit TsaD [Bacteroidota bacterium]|nr:tRNA (adenosine(37)-N6)-threonylcarbamoyltransferase complex transferase subunit TsaD [Bacteroidota bacterium]